MRAEIAFLAWLVFDGLFVSGCRAWPVEGPGGGETEFFVKIDRNSFLEGRFSVATLLCYDEAQRNSCSFTLTSDSTSLHLPSSRYSFILFNRTPSELPEMNFRNMGAYATAEVCFKNDPPSLYSPVEETPETQISYPLAVASAELALNEGSAPTYLRLCPANITATAMVSLKVRNASFIKRAFIGLADQIEGVRLCSKTDNGRRFTRFFSLSVESSEDEEYGSVLSGSGLLFDLQEESNIYKSVESPADTLVKVRLLALLNDSRTVYDTVFQMLQCDSTNSGGERFLTVRASGDSTTQIIPIPPPGSGGNNGFAPHIDQWNEIIEEDLFVE